MPSTLMTPGVYIDERNAFPNSIQPVETGVPVFIGYTEFATRNGKNLLLKPVRITSFAEYVEFFGQDFKAKFDVKPADKSVKIKKDNTFYLYRSIRLFYANGGGPCYILAVGTYGDKPDGLEVKVADLTGAVDLLLKEPEPTLVVVPDAIILGERSYATIYTKILQHCAEVQSRMAIFDLVNPLTAEKKDEVVGTFRDQIGNNHLNYAAAYYPWLKTTVVNPDDVSFENIDNDLLTLLPEPDAHKLITDFKGLAACTEADKKNYHLALKKASLTYAKIIDKIREHLNELPPSGAMAGIFNRVDQSRGVWKAPANVSLDVVNAPNLEISHYEQETLNVDVMAGKSINVIRAFPGVGTLVWGARTLDGNSQDWRYINVRRTLMMIEQSIKMAMRAYAHEPNDANTWVTVKSVIGNFLTNLWKQGALAGAAPEQVFDIQIGLGATMTPNDILDGLMRITIKVAIVRPAEFIVITLQQQMQQS